MKRRQFLQASLLGSGSLLAGISDWLIGAPNTEKWGGTNTRPFIVVFLRGGADGLAILSPLEDKNFLAARPPDMRFEMDKSANSILNLATPSLNKTSFYWHPAAGPLAQLQANKRLIAWPAVGVKNETRSHFEAQEMMERGVDSLQSLPDPFGWMARQVLLNKNQVPSSLNTLPLFAGSANMPRAMQGANQVLAIKDLQGGVSFPGGPTGLKALQALGEVDSNHPAAQSMLGTFNILEEVNGVLPKTDNKVQPYLSAGATPYPESDPGIGLRSAARLIQAKVGLQYVWIDQGGWDTHEAQPGKLNNLVTQLSNGLLAFDEDMKAQSQPYTLVVMTEFGRRLISNKSNGTDHGHGSLSLVMGANLPNEKMMGKWPGLDSSKLNRGVDLAVTTDYLDLLKQAQVWSKV